MIHDRIQNVISNSLLVAFFASIVLYPDTSHAQTALFDSGTNFLTALQNLLTTTWARLIGIIAVALCGIAFMTGRMSWQVAGSVAIGIILIFGAPAIVDSVSGTL